MGTVVAVVFAAAYGPFVYYEQVILSVLVIINYTHWCLNTRCGTSLF